MGKLALITIVGDKDPGIKLSETQYEKHAVLHFFNHKNSKDVSVHAYLNALKKLRLEPTETSMDLLIIACTLYAADTRISRKIHGEDSWTRQIDLYIPVSDVKIWLAQKVTLEKIFRFLTGDIWELYFRERSDKELKLAPKGRLKRYGMPYKTDTVCLFSGGMDSLIGAIDLLSNGITPLLLGHAKSGDVSPFQKNCEAAVLQEFSKKPPYRIYAFIKIPKQNMFGVKENTERGRSFLFLALGAISASCLAKTSKLIVPENGFISLNIPLTPLRTGSHSTRTTHPYYFGLMQELFDGLDLGVKISNPYQFKTKGEMLIDCIKKSIVANTESMSCSHPSGRYQGLGNIHCGYCVPCIIRQASFRSAGIMETPKYRIDIKNKSGLDVNKAEGADIMAFKYMIEKVKRNPGFLISSIRSTGPLGENIEDYVDVYKRSLKEVEDLLQGVIIK